MAIKKLLFSNCWKLREGTMSLQEDPSTRPKEEPNTEEPKTNIPKKEKKIKPEYSSDLPKSVIGAQIALLLIPAIQSKMSRTQIKWSTATASIIPEFHLAI